MGEDVTVLFATERMLMVQDIQLALVLIDWAHGENIAW